MMRQVTSINWRYIGDAIPAFVTLMFIPFSYSAAYGLIAGLMVYTALNGMAYLTELISGGRLVPDDADSREYWTCKLPLVSLLAITNSLAQSNQAAANRGSSRLDMTLQTGSMAIVRTTAHRSRAARPPGAMRG